MALQLYPPGRMSLCLNPRLGPALGVDYPIKQRMIKAVQQPTCQNRPSRKQCLLHLLSEDDSSLQVATRCQHCDVSIDDIEAFAGGLRQDLVAVECGQKALDNDCENAVRAVRQLIDSRLDFTTGQGDDQKFAQAADPSPEELTAALDGYVVHERIARGGMGVVYRATQIDLDREVALKILPSQSRRQRDEAAARFRREARITATLDHPAIVPVYNTGIDSEDRCWYTMKLVRGREFKTIIRNASRQVDDLQDSVATLIRVCEAMQFAHSKGVVHRDLKPANIMVGERGEVYVMDWGLARATTDAVTLPKSNARNSSDQSNAEDDTVDGPLLMTVEGTVLGTPNFMPPEQAAGDNNSVDTRSDIYSVGAILYQVLTGRAPYQVDGSQTPMQTLAAVINEEPTEVTELTENAAPELVAVCRKAMARDRSDRYASTSEIAKELQEWLQNRQSAPDQHAATVAETVVSGTAKVTTDPQSSRPKHLDHSQNRSRRWWIVCTSALLLVLLGAVFFIKTRDGYIRIEINDPMITATLDDGGAVIRKGDDEEIRIKPGKHKLHVSRGDFEFQTHRFIIGRGKNPDLKVEYMEGELVVVDVDGRSILQSTTPQSPDLSPENLSPGTYASAMDGFIIGNNRVDAAWRERNLTYFFQKDQYLVYDSVKNVTSTGIIKDDWKGLPGGFHSNIDAAVRWTDDRAYLLKGNLALRYNIKTKMTESVSTIANTWPTLPVEFHADIDAALFWDEKNAYFFKGDDYVAYHILQDKISELTPRAIAFGWYRAGSAFFSNLDCAVDGSDGWKLLFKGKSYVRHHMDGRVDGPYPVGTPFESPGPESRKRDRCLSFNDDVVRLPHTLLNKLAETTVAFFAKPMAVDTRGLISGINGNSDDNEYLVTVEGPQAVVLYIRSDFVVWFVPDILTGNDFHHIAITTSAADDTAELFFNGKSMGIKPIDIRPWNIDEGGLVLGQDQDSVGGDFSSDQAYHGDLDELTIWNRRLTAEEIVSHRDGKVSADMSNPHAWYKFNEVGNSVVDSTGQHADGTFDAPPQRPTRSTRFVPLRMSESDSELP